MNKSAKHAFSCGGTTIIIDEHANLVPTQTALDKLVERLRKNR